MSARPFRQVDVFGAVPGTGNPLAVVLEADGLSAEEMARFSAWTNLSECTFVLPPTQDGADYRVRIFSLEHELPFAGHPTLGTARAWLDAGGAPGTAGRPVQECGAGLVPVRVDGDRLAFAAPPLVRSGPVGPEDLAPALAVLGVEPDDVAAAAWVDNGPGWLGVQLRDAEHVLALQPDATRAPQRHWDLGVVGAHPPGAEAAFEVRAFFSDASGVLREDPVTGSLNASLGQWLLERGEAAAPWVAAQGTALGRRGRVHLGTADGDLWVGGRADVVVRGDVTI